ncbi:Nonribosomal peptide synthetases (NRPS) [Penicillium chermesinum]|nr:Nonribosomal peptide synthetases (NRPS) [Penicillium chermesinum]
MDNSQSANARFQPAKLVLGKTAAQVLEIDVNTLDWTRSFILLGGDSILAIDFVARCRDAGIHVDMRELLMAESLGALAEQIDQRMQDQPPESMAMTMETTICLLPTGKILCRTSWSQTSRPTVSPWATSNRLRRAPPCRKASLSAKRSTLLPTLAIFPSGCSRLRPIVGDLHRRGSSMHGEALSSAMRSSGRHLSRATTVRANLTNLSSNITLYPPRVIICPSKSDARAVPPFTTGKFETPLRLCVYEVSDKELRLMLEISHALVDGHSGEILLHDFRASYERAAYFSENALSYTYFASHQQAAGSTGVASTGAEYWTTYLNNASESHLPVIASTPQLLHLKTTHCSITLPGSKLRAVCSQMMITPANLFQIAWALAIRRIILSDAITFSHIVSGRNCDLKGAEGTVGPFINTLPYSVTLNPETSVADALFAARRDWQDGLPFQNIPIADLAVAKTRSLKHLGNTLLSIERGPTNTHVFTEGVSMTLDARTSATDYDLSANVRFSDDQIDLSLEYWASRVAWPVAKAQMTAFQDAVAFLLDGASSMSIRDFPSHSIEDGLAISRWNSAMPPRVERCVHEIVRDKLTAQPKAQAVSAWDGELTYGELDEMSRRLAYHLVEQGVGPEVMVGMCMNKSKFGVVAMLAILRAGGAVVPLGVQHPLARLEHIATDTSAPIILVDRTHKRRLTALANLRLLAIDSFFDIAPATPTPATEPCLSVEPNNAAWVIYTSGSTGKPKGVVLEHGAVATSILAHGPAIGIQAHDRLSQFAAYTFDVSIAEIMTPLSIGACICVPSEHDRISRLTAFLSDANVTVATLTSTIAALVQPEDTPAIRTLILTGEALLPKVVDQWIQHATIINAYGPSENSIWTTVKQVRDSSEANNIGTPLAGALWVVNPANIAELVPVGVPGELLLDGPLLARGYLNDPAKTAAAFVTDPAFEKALGLCPGRRMYRTGDMVQQHPDGSVTYLGRRDTQVKIRGQRVEIGEIESQIVRILSDVREAIVDIIRPADEPDDGVLMLVAVVEYPGAGLSSSTGDLELYDPATITDTTREAIKVLDTKLGQVLPAYMVPTAFLLAPTLPVNTSGKLDRRTVKDQLRLMSRDSFSSFFYSTITKQAPTTAIESQLQSLFATVLSLSPDQVGINDSFFRLGGDSVVAMKLTTAARAEKLPLSVADIFQRPYLVDMAAAMEGKSVLTNDQEINGSTLKDPAPLSLWPELAQAGASNKDQERLLADIAIQCGIATSQIEDIYPCSPLQAGLIAITTQHSQAYILQRVFSLEADLSIDRLKAACARLARADALQVVVRDQQPTWQHSTSLDDYLAADKSTPITYGGVLSRMAIVESEDRTNRYFVWTTHHSIYDGWSMGKMMKMLVQLLQGEVVPAPVPVSRFIGYLAQQDKQQTAKFWKDHLEGANWVSYPPLPFLNYKAEPHDLLNQEISIPRTAGAVTVPTLLRAAWALLVAAHIGADEAIINIVLSGRMAQIDGITDIVAPTITSVPFRASTWKEQTVREFLATMQEQSIQMIPFEHTGLQNIRRIVSSLGPDFDAGHMFVVQLAEESELSPRLDMFFKRELTTADAFYAHPLNVECTVSQGSSRVRVEVRYDRKVLPVDDAQRVLAQFVHIVQQLAKDTEGGQLLGQIQVLSTQRMQRSCLKWNSSVPAGIDCCIHQLVQEQIDSQPEAQAVSAWDGDLTYGELDEMSRQLAYHLVDQGVGPEVIVGLCMDKSKFGVVAMLAILRAGGAVVSLGVQYPVSRTRDIVKDTATPIVLVDCAHEQRLSELVTYTQLLAVDTFFSRALLTRSTKPLTATQPENMAWVIYTSGSTGTPKGVVLEHSALATSILAHGRAFDIQPYDRLSQFAAYTFDVAIQEVMTTLVFGACICIPSEDDRVNQLTFFLSKANVSIVTFTSTVAALVQPTDVPSVRALVLMGEAVQPKVVDQWAQHATIINAYGPFGVLYPYYRKQNPAQIRKP